MTDELARVGANVRTPVAETASSWQRAREVVVLAAKLEDQFSAERAQQTMIEALHFLDCVARSHNSLVEPSSHLPTLSLVRHSEETFERVEGAPSEQDEPGVR